VGYLATCENLKTFQSEYLFLTVVSALSCYIILQKLSFQIHKHLPLWIFFGIFIMAYYLKYYIMVFYPDIIVALSDAPTIKSAVRHALISEPGVSIRCFAIITYGFSIFCLLSRLLLNYLTVETIPYQSESLRKNSSVFLILFISIPILIIATSWIMYVAKIGVMGSVFAELPFRIAGWIFYMRMSLIPGLILLLILLGERAQSSKYMIAGIAFLFLYALTDMALRSSRSSLIVFSFMLLLLFMIMQKLTIKRVGIFIVSILLTIILFPIIYLSRGLRFHHPSLSLLQVFNETINRMFVSGTSTITDLFQNSLTSIFQRITGIDSLALAVKHGSSYIGLDFFGLSVGNFYNNEVMGVIPNNPMGFAPSLLGWFYVAGGHWMVVAGVIGATALIWTVWFFLCRSGLKTLPVIKVLLMSWFFWTAIEGTLDRLHIGILVMTGSAIMCEGLTRLALMIDVKKTNTDKTLIRNI
jgi:hypothetical protein